MWPAWASRQWWQVGGWLGGWGNALPGSLQGCPREWQGQEVLSFSCLHSSSETWCCRGRHCLPRAELSSKQAGVLVSTATPRLIEGLKAEVSLAVAVSVSCECVAVRVPVCRCWLVQICGGVCSPAHMPSAHISELCPPTCSPFNLNLDPPQASDVVSSSLDILAELTTRYGSVLPDQEGLKRALLPELDESRAGVRKRAIQCLACLATSLPSDSLDDLCATGEGGGGAGGRRSACTPTPPMHAGTHIGSAHRQRWRPALLLRLPAIPTHHCTSPPALPCCSVCAAGEQGSEAGHGPHIHPGSGGHQVGALSRACLPDRCLYTPVLCCSLHAAAFGPKCPPLPLCTFSGVAVLLQQGRGP